MAPVLLKLRFVLYAGAAVFAVTRLVAGAGAAGVEPTRTFQGRSLDGGEVAVNVQGRRVTGFFARGVSTRCRSGALEPANLVFFLPQAARAGGGFAAALSYALPWPDRSEERVSARVDGSTSPATARANGGLTVVIRYVRAGGSVSDRCRLRTRWAALA